MIECVHKVETLKKEKGEDKNEFSEKQTDVAMSKNVEISHVIDKQSKIQKRKRIL